MMPSYQDQEFSIIEYQSLKRRKMKWRVRFLYMIWFIYVVNINTIELNSSMNLFYAKRSTFTFHKHIELTSKVITQVFADQSRSEIIMYLILTV